MNVRRAYAIVTVESRPSSALLALNGSMVSGRPLVVQPVGDSPMHRLKDICRAQAIGMPSFAIVKKEEEAEDQDGDGVPRYVATATWPALGGVIIQAPQVYGTITEARQGVAKECLEFLHLQQHDHRVTKEQGTGASVSDPGSGSEGEDDEPSDSGDRLVPLTVNLIDCPGHIDFSGEVTASLRLSDGALVVVDAVEGKAAQTEGVIVQALREGVTPVLMLNKVDRLFVSKQYGPEEVYDQMMRVVNDVNALIRTHQLDGFPDQQVSFETGSVCFGSGYYGWACSIDSFLNSKDLAGGETREYAGKYLSKRENFIKYIIGPIFRMHRICGVLPTKKKLGKLNRVVKINEVLSDKVPGWSARKLLRGEDASTITPQDLLKRAMMAWLPAANPLIDMIAAHVPSPAEAQKLRAGLLYDGDIADASGQGIYNCAAGGPTVVYISKMDMSGQSGKKRLAFGRVFSGTLRPGDTLRAIRADGTDRMTKVSQIKLHGLGGEMKSIPQARAGQLIALEGVDEALGKAGTLTSSPDGMPIRHMNFAVTPIVQHSVRPKVQTDFTKMVTTLQRIVDTDSTALFYKDLESGEHILAGAGELHIEVLVSSLKEKSGIEVELSEPIIAYRETVQTTSREAALAKSVNKHNRVWIKASPLNENIVRAMSSGELVDLDAKALGRELASSFGWSSTDASRIWATAPEPLRRSAEVSEMDRPTCILVDSTFGLQIPEDARSNIIAAFLQITRQGVLVNAPMRGIRFDLVDARFHQDSVHRRPNSVVPMASRAMRGGMLMADPTLVEPMYCVNVTGALGTLHSAYSVLGQRGGVIVDTEVTKTTESIRAKLPVRLSFGLAGTLRLATRGHAQVSCHFDGMKMVPVDQQRSIVSEARLSKGLDDGIPEASVFIDRL